MYVCGPTVYGPPHIGHGRFSLNFDVLRRYLEWSGFEVTYVSNVTDIDDKIIEKARAEGCEWTEITARYEALWWEAMAAIGVKAPTASPHATDYVDDMVTLIAHLMAIGAAYETSDGIYFRPAIVGDYGLLARQDVESLQSGARVEVIDEKESAIDFVLWKKAKPGEPSWPSPWGDGRPGWHTECVVMSLDILGDGFDLHGGGQDLAFPHHENERAQAVASGHHFANHWMHNGFVEVVSTGGEAEKMSKSLGNFTDLLDLVESVDPRAYRMLCLQAHYRSPFEVTAGTTAQAAAALERLDAVGRRVRGMATDAEPDEAVIGRFVARMDDDLDTPGALAVIFETVSEINRCLDDGRLQEAVAPIAALRSMLDAVGLVIDEGSSEIPDEIAARCAERDDARAAKDWARSDEIREQLRAQGWVVDDTAGGTEVRPA